jgi:hypothetical protein
LDLLVLVTTSDGAEVRAPADGFVGRPKDLPPRAARKLFSAFSLSSWSLPGQDFLRFLFEQLELAGTRSVWAAGLEGLFAAEHVPAGDQDLARDRRLGRVGLAGARLDVSVEPVPGVGLTPGALGGLDGGETQGARAGLGQLTTARALAGLLDARGQARVADQLARTSKAGHVADLGRDGQA